ncbi:sigma factor-like helix-turn-helix DNA-binding protein [Saccharibacillus kuerlensis]|uniref:DNA-directed RNA polymerase sigma-70 factor n=1 Tax=Saccharibacillus kuerlensis TaxID=459527 RepID=A0ABQ2L1W3_9BACL|nr:sigma factor-like helix-turn-helix DNA-binding protein [Saccharibacillus kuerlensis]GGN98095.1 DNA-directed RNA polymerase sigma-70 factor [Saccharibacillus kuerlensis]
MKRMEAGLEDRKLVSQRESVPMTIVVIGGGYAGLQTLFSLKKELRIEAAKGMGETKERAAGLPGFATSGGGGAVGKKWAGTRLILVDREACHVRKVMLFRRAARPEELEISFTELEQHGIEFVQGAVTEIHHLEQRLVLKHLQRELYIGPWLPEPIPTGDGDPAAIYLQDEGVSFAILLLLETLDPIERAVYILREAFAFDYRAIAEATGRSEAACRKTMSRLRPKIAAACPPQGLLPAEKAEPLVLQFLHAARTGDMHGMIEMLHADAVLRSDGGGRVTAAVRPIVGAQAVTAFLAGLAKKFAHSPEGKGAPTGIAPELQLRSVNGQLGLVYKEDGHTDTVFVIEISAGRIQSVYAVRNPDKLQRFVAY